MERMGIEYQRFDGKEYVSLKRYYNLLCKCKALEKENKNLKSERDNCLKEVKLCYNDIHSLEGQISDLEKENKNLKDELQEWLNAVGNK